MPVPLNSSPDIRDLILQRCEPFKAIQVDIELAQRPAPAPTRFTELRKPLLEFASAEHMAMFGRPLWLVYSYLRDFALAKLLCGLSKHDPYKDNHAFAA